MTHPALRFLERALEDLRSAHNRFGEGSVEYVAEMRQTSYAIECLESIIADTRYTDEQLDPEAMAERKAWDRQTRPNWGPL